MSVTKTITLDVDTKQAVKSLKDLEHEVSNLIDETNELNETNQLFKKELAALDAQYKKIPKSAMSARKAMGDQMEHLKVAIQDNNLALRDFRIKKQQKQKMISDLKHIHSKALHTTEGFAQLGSVLGGVATGMLHMAGASEETTEAFEGAVHSIETVEHVTEGATKAQKVYQTQVKGTSIATKLLSVVQGAYAAVVGTSTGALKLFRLALISTGIGAIVVGVGLLIANFDKLSKIIKGNLIKNFQKSGIAVKALMLAFAPLILTIKAVKEGLELIGVGESDAEKRRKTNASNARMRAELEKKEHEEKLRQIKEERDAHQAAFDRWLKLQQAKGIDTRVEEQNKLNSDLKQLEQDRAKENKDYNEDIASEQRYYDSQLRRDKEQLARDLAKIEAGGAGSAFDIQRRFNKKREQSDRTHNRTLLASQKKFLTTKAEQVEIAQNNADVFAQETINKEKEDRKAANARWKTYAAERLSIARQIQDMENSLLEDGIDKELEINKVKFERLIADMKGTSKEKEKLKALYEKQEQEAVQKIKDKYAKIDEAREKARLKNIEDQNNAFLDKIAEIEEQNYQNTLSDEERELRAVQDKYFALEAAAEGNADALLQIEIARLNEENNIKLKYQNEADAAQKVRDDKKKADAKEIEDFKLETASQGLSAISNLAALFGGKSEKAAKRAFQVQKAVSIAQATIDTYKSANAIFASTSANPITILNPSAPFIAAGVAVAAGLVNVATIASQKFQGGGGGGGGGQQSAPDLTGGAVSPSFNVVGDSGVNQLAQIQASPTQAFVVSGEVTTSQALDRNRVQNATL